MHEEEVPHQGPPEVAAAVAGQLESLGFKVTREEPEQTGRYIGYTPSVVPPRWEPEATKLGHLSRLLRLLLETEWVPVDVVHTAVSIYVWMALLWRPALSMPCHAFRFCREGAGFVRRLRPSVKEELYLMEGFLPFIFADLGRPAAPVVVVGVTAFVWVATPVALVVAFAITMARNRLRQGPHAVVAVIVAAVARVVDEAAC